MEKVRSPLFYVGDKYKLMPQLLKVFPDNIDTFYDVFTGGGSSSLYTTANKYVLNDIDRNIIDLHVYLNSVLKNIDEFKEHEYKLIEKYNLTRSSHNILPKNIKDLKKEYKKTYYARINKEGYLALRNDFNKDQSRKDLFYLLLVFGFNHMTRFNAKGDFNLPVGNVDWNRNVEKALNNYSDFSILSEVKYTNYDFEKMIEIFMPKAKDNDFFYFDPPYSISLSEYNKLWNRDDDSRLFNLLDKLDAQKIKWGMSNVFSHKGQKNIELINWSKKYNVYPIKANYISRFDNSFKEDTKEVYITNFKE